MLFCEDILVEIFSHCSLSELVRYRIISKTWQKLINLHYCRDYRLKIIIKDEWLFILKVKYSGMQFQFNLDLIPNDYLDPYSERYDLLLFEIVKFDQNHQNQFYLEFIDYESDKEIYILTESYFKIKICKEEDKYHHLKLKIKNNKITVLQILKAIVKQMNFILTENDR